MISIRNADVLSSVQLLGRWQRLRHRDFDQVRPRTGQFLKNRRIPFCRHILTYFERQIGFQGTSYRQVASAPLLVHLHSPVVGPDTHTDPRLVQRNPDNVSYSTDSRIAPSKSSSSTPP